MMGPADRTDRFTYWPVRLSRGGEIMVPGQGKDPVQYIDVRDVADWMIRLIESRGKQRRQACMRSSMVRTPPSAQLPPS